MCSISVSLGGSYHAFAHPDPPQSSMCVRRFPKCSLFDRLSIRRHSMKATRYADHTGVWKMLTTVP
jgi:hypothetical protein